MPVERLMEAMSLLVNLALPKSKAWWEFFKEREVQRYSQWGDERDRPKARRGSCCFIKSASEKG